MKMFTLVLSQNIWVFNVSFFQLSSKSEIIQKRGGGEGSPDDQVEINAPLSYQNYYRLCYFEISPTHQF